MELPPPTFPTPTFPSDATDFITLPRNFIEQAGRLGVSGACQRLVLAVLSFQYGEERLPDPLQTTLAAELGTSVRHVQYAVSELKRGGFLVMRRTFLSRHGYWRMGYDFRPLWQKIEALTVSDEERFGTMLGK